MGKYKIGIAVLVAGLLVGSMYGVSLAQEEVEEEIVVEEEIEYSWGTAKKISSGQIVVSEWDTDSSEKVDVAYIIDPKVKFKNVKSLKDITVGDGVDIDYVVRDDKRVAKVIVVSKPSEVEEAAETEVEEVEEKLE